MDILDKLNDMKQPWQMIHSLTVKQIIPIIKIASDHYYNTDHPLISDDVFDMLIDQLTILDPKNAWFKGVGFSQRGEKTKLPFWMGSLDKFKMGDKQFSSWMDKHKAPFVISDKLDGISGLLYHKKNGTNTLYTRGNGDKGRDISYLIPHMHINVDKLPHVDIAIRGELVISRADFDKKYAKKMDKARNMAAGIANTKETSLGSSVKDLRFVTYEIIYPELEPSNQMSLLKKYGMDVVFYQEVNDKFELEYLDKFLKKRREKSPYEIDGIVITEDKKHKRNTSGDPSYSFAFKGITETALSVVDKVTWTPSKDGYLTPRVWFDPVRLSGATIQKATGFNAKFIVDNKIGPGAKVRVIRRHDTIPEVMETIKPAKVSGLPTNYKYHWNDNKVYIILDNPDEDESVKMRKMMKFLQEIKMEFLGEGLVGRLVDHGIDTPVKILSVTPGDLMKIDGFKETLANKIVSNLRKAINNIDTLSLMSASNLLGRGLGRKKLEVILERYPHFVRDFDKYSKNEWRDKLLQLPGFQQTTVDKIIDNMPVYLKFQNKISKQIDVKQFKSKIKKNGKFAGMSIVFTGFRNTPWETLIKNEGGKMSSTVSNNTSILVYVDSAMNTSKYIKGDQLNKMKVKPKIVLITKDNFENKFINGQFDPDLFVRK